ncbi:MAG: hypothetical protein HDR88_12410 [Bacteroides sp.]|nr:hypothetical protein [Bacteroides sp.]
MKLSELIDFVPKQEHKLSPLNVYRDIFTVEISNDGHSDYTRIRMKDHNSYQKPITLRQVAWYNGVQPDDKEDVALTIAATICAEEILTAYLTQQPIYDLRNNIKSVNAVKKKDRRYALRISMNDGMPIPIISMDNRNEIYYRRLSPKDRQDFLLYLAVHYLTSEDASKLIQGVKQTTKS